MADIWKTGGLHWSFQEEHVLIPSLRLHSFATFLITSILTICICVGERCVSRLLERRWHPSSRCSRWQKVAWAAVLYWLAIFLRLNYMLIAMTFHLGLILVIVTTLATTQFFIELVCCSRTDTDRLIDSQDTLLSERTHRPRSKSKPDAIFIHPAQSNLARADAAALELGLSGSTDRVHGNRFQREESAWEVGAGQGAARALLGSANRKTSERDPFLISDELGSD